MTTDSDTDTSYHIDFSAQPIGTKLVFHQRGAYMNEDYTFGIVIAGPKKTKRVQIVETIREQKNNDPITVYYKLTPQWDKPILNEIYCVYVGKSGEMKGLSWLRSYPDCGGGTCPSKYAPWLLGVYDETQKYEDCSDSP
jgi:hypothetical protein